jgi:hypothetical protein
MRNLFISASLLLLITPVGAQYGGDPGRTYTDQMVIDNINRRAMERRVKARSSSSAPKSTHKSKRRTAKVRYRAVALTGELNLGQDLYSSFGEDDHRIYTFETRLTPVAKGQKPIVRWTRVIASKRDSIILQNIPRGNYVSVCDCTVRRKTSFPYS